MKILQAKNSGFCYGVQRAWEKTNAALNQYPKPIYTFGPLIHNPQAVAELSKRGIKVIENLNQIKKGVLIIRSHGIAPDILKRLKKRRNLKIIDLTCPYVKNAQHLAQQLNQEGYLVVIIGDKNHPEVKGIFGAVKGDATIVHSVKDVKRLKSSKKWRDRLKGKSKLGIVVQTTQTIEKLKIITAELIPCLKEMKIYNTICSATLNNQEEAKRLAKKVDIMLVIGGHNSANTSSLANICKGLGVPTYHIETKKELKKEWFKDKQKVGVTAGTSTPDWLIKEVVEELKVID